MLSLSLCFCVPLLDAIYRFILCHERVISIIPIYSFAAHLHTRLLGSNLSLYHLPKPLHARSFWLYASFSSWWQCARARSQQQRRVFFAPFPSPSPSISTTIYPLPPPPPAQSPPDLISSGSAINLCAPIVGSVRKSRVYSRKKCKSEQLSLSLLPHAPTQTRIAELIPLKSKAILTPTPQHEARGLEGSGLVEVHSGTGVIQ